jgi:hypothetical protein
MNAFHCSVETLKCTRSGDSVSFAMHSSYNGITERRTPVRARFAEVWCSTNRRSGPRDDSPHEVALRWLAAISKDRWSRTPRLRRPHVCKFVRRIISRTLLRLPYSKADAVPSSARWRSCSSSTEGAHEGARAWPSGRIRGPRWGVASSRGGVLVTRAKPANPCACWSGTATHANSHRLLSNLTGRLSRNQPARLHALLPTGE